MNSLWPSRASNDANPAPSKQTADMGDAGAAEVRSEQPERANPPLSFRPILQRNVSSQPPPAVPPPPQQPPPPPVMNGAQQAQQQQSTAPADSLSLAQLRRIVAEFPRTEAAAYDFVYEDMGPIEEEVDEWFVYQFWQWVRLNAAQRAFESKWEHDFGAETHWEQVEHETRKTFVSGALEALSSPEPKCRSGFLGIITYIALGRWGHTAGGASPAAGKDKKARCAATPSQVEAMKVGTKLIAEAGGISMVWDALRKAFDPFWVEEAQHMQASNLQEAQDELTNLMTVMYMIIQEALNDQEEFGEVCEQLRQLKPGLVEFLSEVIAKLRWDEASIVPHAQVFLLFWKSVLLVFGGSKELAEAKKATSDHPYEDGKDKDIIMASPLDYHVFRQEITSKYPAYIPPQLSVPLEPDNSSFLPPLPHQTTRNNGANGILPPQPGSQTGGASILHQPVHIATPAPSPPPSPGVGGKGGKKQNYQTNQNFPFMYPPLDASSNSTGGKGNAALQDVLVGRRWEGSDVPASILEAGELFSKRVRMTRALRQLWEERERFMKFERGWDATDSDIIDELDLSSLTLEEKEELGLVKPENKPAPEDVEVDYGPNPELLSERIKQRLDAVEKFYAGSVSQLQSTVIALLRVLLVQYTVLMTQQPQIPQQYAGMPGVNGRANGGGPMRSHDGSNGAANGSANAEPPELSSEELDAARTREITQKAVTGVILLLLKWFKISHILKFEFLTQLLLDCNYMPLVLKLFIHQDVQQVVESKTDRIENSFFYFCNIRAGASEKAPADDPEEKEESEDDAAPPAIKRRRSPPPAPATDGAAESSLAKSENGQPVRPEVDELGYPVNPLPKEPITDFSRRNFFTLINYLRILQKVCKNKAHRNLLLVHYKSGGVLRKNLKVPQEELRLYTLKLFKNQVPYCGRKWRQSNMRVITAVYLHCRPELRDEWLAGSDIDAEVEEALPLEQALRSITHWFNVRRYPDEMATEVRDALKEEQDFFVRELEKLEVAWEQMGGEESVNSEWESELSGWG